MHNIEVFLNSIFKFNNLNELSINFETSDDCDQSIDKYLTQISENNPSLKYLNFSLYTRSVKIDKIFYAFEGFENLFELVVYISNTSENKTIRGSVQLFKSIKKLKSLKLTYEHFDE